MKQHLFHAVAPLLAIGMLAACQQAPATPVPAANMTMSENNAIVIVNARAAGLARKLLASNPQTRPLTFDDLVQVRFSIHDGGGAFISDFKILNPDSPYITAVFSSLKADANYTIKAAAYDVDPGAAYDQASPVATDEESIDVDNYLTPTKVNLTLQLPDVAFDATATGAISIVSGDWIDPVATESIEATTATPPSL